MWILVSLIVLSSLACILANEVDISTRTKDLKEQLRPYIAVSAMVAQETRNGVMGSTSSIPDNTRLLLAENWRQLGLLLQYEYIQKHNGEERHVEAVEAFDHVLQLIRAEDDNYKRYTVEMNFYKGIMLKMMGEGKEAVKCYNKVISMTSNRFDLSTALVNKADALAMMKQLNQSVAAYRLSLESTPARLSVYSPLTSLYSDLKWYDSREGWEGYLMDLIEMKRNITQRDEDDPTLSQAILPYNEASSSDYYWGVYKAAELAGKYDVAWQYLEDAHRIEKSNAHEDFSRDALIDQTQRTLEIFNEGFFELEVGHGSKLPIFIIGMMRSGSSLLESMLDSHDSVWGMGEDSVFNGNLAAFRDEIVQSFATNDINTIQQTTNVHGDKVITAMLNKAKGYTKSAKKNEIKHVVDKMLFNYRNIGFIRLLFPNAVIIHTMRDPLDTLLSCYTHKFNDRGLSWSLVAEDLVLQYVKYLEIIHHFRKVLPGHVHDVLYEELVTNPVPVLQTILKKIGIDWDDSMLTFYNSKRIVHTHSQSQVRKRLYSNSIGNWRKYSTQMESIIQLLRPQLNKLQKKGALLYKDRINWALDYDFNYSRYQIVNDTLPAAPTAIPGVTDALPTQPVEDISPIVVNVHDSLVDNCEKKCEPKTCQCDQDRMKPSTATVLHNRIAEVTKGETITLHRDGSMTKSCTIKI